jgi:hypothetical protein
MTKKKPPELRQQDGAKTTYTVAVAERICTMISKGRTITSICSDDDMPGLDAVYGWLRKQPAFAEAYARAREDQQDTFAAQIVDISDTETDPQRARNRIDARKWHAAKTAPRKYGDKLELDAKIEHNSGPSEGLTLMLAMLEKAQGGGRH